MVVINLTSIRATWFITFIFHFFFLKKPLSVITVRETIVLIITLSHIDVWILASGSFMSSQFLDEGIKWIG
jgi:hypothetical protein